MKYRTVTVLFCFIYVLVWFSGSVRTDPGLYPILNCHFILIDSFMRLVFINILPTPSLVINATIIMMIIVIIMSIMIVGNGIWMRWEPENKYHDKNHNSDP